MTNKQILGKIILLISVQSFLLMNCGCAIKLPKITATGERTALENQIIGSYKSIEDEVWMVASVRTETPPDTINLTEQKRKILEAFQRQRFNADDISDFKRNGIVGENNAGLLEIRSSQKYETDSDYRNLVDKITNEENEDRLMIMQRIIELHPEIDPNDRPKVGQVYARLKQEASPDGTWIQNSDGEWKKK